MVDVEVLKSHPHKKLFTHVNGVIENTKKLTENIDGAKWAELVAIFHDLGKINSNFQDKLKPEKKASGYTHHAYLSAYAFYGIFRFLKENFSILKEWLNCNILTENEIVALTILIAKHHGHLPDFCPKSDNESTGYILSKDEINDLYKFLSKKLESLPIEEFTRYFEEFKEIKPFKNLLNNEKAQKHFLEKIIFSPKYTQDHLDFFLNTQFAFSALIQADKTDAMDSKIIEEDKANVKEFCEIYTKTLRKYISRFRPNSELNILRTQIREESLENIKLPLQEGKRVFELTAPTGSGKTIMLLSLASQIIEQKGNYRVMYALPFLSITEQVEKEVLEIFEGYADKNYIQRIDSKSENEKFNQIQASLDTEPDKTKIKELDFLAFQEQVFAHPFIITTFVRFFETLLSNHNATLLKLPNFSKSIFLLDEIQSLPPRLYTFFIAYLTKFCEKFDSYAIISTATQPNFELPQKREIQDFFNTYNRPISILEHNKYFENDIFNRYQITHWKENIKIDKLAEKVLAENNSVLVILNTVDDSKDLFAILKEELESDELALLNTHFTPNDRKYKIDYIKLRLKYKKRIIAISTQLIEAGVDIDFPVLYRDFALVSSIVQSAGRCNRNGKLLNKGKVVLVNLVKEGKSRANLIYGRGKDKDILTFTKKALGNTESYQEKELLKVQNEFFKEISTKLHFAKHSQNTFKLEFDFLEDIKECAFAKIGKFKLIDEQEYGEPKRYYVPENEEDNNFEKLLELDEEINVIVQSNTKHWDEINRVKYAIQSKLKRMANQVVQIRLRKQDEEPNLGNSKNFAGLHKLHLNSYSIEMGIDLQGQDIIL
jgi:CRISPR-associated endonuclease/helicase Cas3